MTGTSRLRATWPWAAALAALVVVGLAVGRDGEGAPLDPDGTGPAGTKALVDTLREVGAAVTVTDGSPDPLATTAVVFLDGLDDPARSRVDGWVRSGGRLVVTDPESPLNPARLAADERPSFAGPELRRDCELPALRDVEEVWVPGAVLLPRAPGSTTCFRGGGPAGGPAEGWVVVTPVGRGVVVSLGGPGAFVNSSLGEADNAVLAVSLLAPRVGDRVAVLRPPGPGGGDEGVLGLVPDRVTLALLQLGVAFLVVVAWRSRRLGRPVAERLPVEVRGSGLVVAVGELLQRARARSRAAAVLRDDLRADLAGRVGLPASAPPEVVAASVAAGSGLRAEEVLAVLEAPDPVDEAGVVRLAADVERVRREVAGGR